MPATSAESQDVIVVDRDDDLGSLRSKIESTAADEIFLVLPRESVVLRSPVEFRVFARMLQSLASEIVIVSGDGERRRLARMAGFRTRRGLHGLLHLLPPEEANRFRFRWYRFWRWFPIVPFLTLLTPALLVLGLVAVVLVVLPELRVTMAPATDVDSALLDLRVDPGVRQPDPEGRRLPGTMLSQRFEVEASVPASGVGHRPTAAAKGVVTFVNSRENVLVVPEGLVLVATNGTRFATDAEVRLPPNSLVGTRVSIHALEPGPAGNVPAMAITRLVEAQPPGLGVFNERPTEGGREEEFPEAAERDFIAVRGELQQKLEQAARDRLAELARDEYTVVPDSLRVETTNETFSPGLRAPTEEVTGRVTVQATALAYANAAFNELAEAAWAASLPAGFRPLAGPADLTVPEYLGLDGGTALYRVGVRGRIARVMDAATLAARLRGATLDEARRALAAPGGLGAPVAIEMWPSWAPRAFRLRLLAVGSE
ncbi:MAG TPA: baseplate J/gp47 family protein [Chloroflexota bacterium]|nr:baseplate J/gp47 family protein [Chloroflexota bacterium]